MWLKLPDNAFHSLSIHGHDRVTILLCHPRYFFKTLSHQWQIWRSKLPLYLVAKCSLLLQEAITLFFFFNCFIIHMCHHFILYPEFSHSHSMNLSWAQPIRNWTYVDFILTSVACTLHGFGQVNQAIWIWFLSSPLSKTKQKVHYIKVVVSKTWNLNFSLPNDMWRMRMEKSWLRMSPFHDEHLSRFLQDVCLSILQQCSHKHQSQSEVMPGSLNLKSEKQRLIEVWSPVWHQVASVGGVRGPHCL
jgi:hypothetical protein